MSLALPQILNNQYQPMTLAEKKRARDNICAAALDRYTDQVTNRTVSADESTTGGEDLTLPLFQDYNGAVLGSLSITITGLTETDDFNMLARFGWTTNYQGGTSYYGNWTSWPMLNNAGTAIGGGTLEARIALSVGGDMQEYYRLTGTHLYLMWIPGKVNAGAVVNLAIQCSQIACIDNI